MASFTINNTSSSSVTYQGITITAGNSYTPPEPGTNFVEDFLLIKDIIAGNVTLTFGADTYASDTALKIVSAINQKSTTIDINNSTSSTLLAGATFTGIWSQVSTYSNVTILIFTNQNSATNGFVVEYSTDGVNVDDDDTFSIFASNGQQFSFPLTSSYYRIKYTNGATNQDSFRMQSKLHENRPKPSSHRLSDSVIGDSDVELNKSIVAGIKSNGSSDNVRISNNNELQISDICNNSGIEGAITATTSATAVRVGGSNLTNRKILSFFNNGTATLYWGYTNSVTSSTGTPLMRNQHVFGDWGPSTTIYIIAASGSHDVRVTEGA